MSGRRKLSDLLWIVAFIRSFPLMHDQKRLDDNVRSLLMNPQWRAARMRRRKP